MPTPTERLPVQRVSRFDLDPSALQRLGRRQGGWVGGTLGGALLLLGSGVPAGVPELALLPLGLGSILAFPRTPVRGACLTAAALATALLIGLVTPGTSTLSQWLSTQAPTSAPDLHAAQVVGSTLVLGGLLHTLDGGPRDLFRGVHGALALASTTGLGIWAATQLMQPDWVSWATVAIGSTTVGLVSAQTLLVLTLRFRTTDRIPARNIIARTLGDTHRGPALAAWQLDQDLTVLCPDHDTRDGLGEVATWVYRLQWIRQRLDAETSRVGGASVLKRITTLSEEAVQSTDSFTRDRLLATVTHLQRLQSHRGALEAERARTAALAEFAVAFLEEARADLTMAQVQPGASRPDRLPEVLTRLRTYSADQALARQTRRELASLPA